MTLKPITFLGICFFWIALTTNSNAQSQNFGDITYSKAINIAGKQRMLSQKIAKAYVLMTKGINPPEITKELNTSKFIFEKQLEILKQNANSSSTKIAVKDIEKVWLPFKAIIESPPSVPNASEILTANTLLLNAAHQLVLKIKSGSSYNNQFFRTTNQELIGVINISGKQRMLAQRLCLYYTACTLFPENNTPYQKILNEVYAEFNSAIGTLLIQSDNTTEIEEELGYVMSIWQPFQTNTSGLLQNEFPLETVFTTTNNLTKSFNKITGWYEKIAN